jgi:predicted RNA binding protein YcfA (HicA-like mRNA interferase family)
LSIVIGSHYVLAHTDNAALAVTVPYHGNRDLKPGTLRSIIRQAGLSVDELIDLL